MEQLENNTICDNVKLRIGCLKWKKSVKEGKIDMVVHPLSNLFQKIASLTHDRDRSTTQTASFIAASFRT